MESRPYPLRCNPKLIFAKMINLKIKNFFIRIYNEMNCVVVYFFGLIKKNTDL